jgi:hypothetical protein
MGHGLREASAGGENGRDVHRPLVGRVGARFRTSCIESVRRTRMEGSCVPTVTEEQSTRAQTREPHGMFPEVVFMTGQIWGSQEPDRQGRAVETGRRLYELALRYWVEGRNDDALRVGLVAAEILKPALDRSALADEVNSMLLALRGHAEEGSRPSSE